MTGKQFKAFANQVPDEAVVEIETNPSSYRAEWMKLDPKKIQARLMLKPQVTEEQVDEQEQVEA